MKLFRQFAGTILILFALMFLGPNIALAANGTITGTFKGPHGEEASNVAYSVTNNTTGAVTTGTSNSAGVFSITLDSSYQYTFAATPDTTKAGFAYANPFSFPYMGVPSGGTVNVGSIFFPMKPGESDPDVDAEEETLPEQCLAVPVAGGPSIIRIESIDAARGSFMYTGREVGVVIYANRSGLTVTADYSIVEGEQFGTTVVAATDNGDGSYTAPHTLVTTEEGGGLVIATATDGSNTIGGCSQPGPVNLDIRNELPPNAPAGTEPFLNGSDTTDFTSVVDFRAIEDFTMHADGLFKVVFPNKLNMLDPTVQNFMKTLFVNIPEKSNGLFGLDAKSVLELKNSGAVITMYNIPDYLTPPTILLDGSDAGSAVTDVVYDRAAHTLTFDAAHFSTYSAVPVISLTAPTDKTTTSDTTVTVSGTVNDVNATVKITVGGTDQGTITVGSDGKFSKSVSLARGDNAIKVNASNSTGSAIEVSRTVTRQALPATGVSQNVLIGIGLMLAFGITALVLSRRKIDARA